MQNIKITTCSVADVAALRKISIETFYETFKDQNSAENMQEYLETAFSVAKLEREVTNPHSQFMFMYVEDEVAGYLKLNTGSAQSENMGDEALEVERIYIAKTYQKLGLGKHFIKKAIDIAEDNHKQKIWLGVWEKNVNAIAFYERMGFVQAGTHSFQMGDEEQIDYIMVKELT